MKTWQEIAIELQELVMLLEAEDSTKRESIGVLSLYLQKLRSLKEAAIKNSQTELQAG